MTKENQDVVLPSRGRIIIRVQPDAPKYRGVIALSAGEGTRESPLHFVFLACHADMADDASIATTERSTMVLAEAVFARLMDQRSDVRDVLHASNSAAVDTDRYYSIVLGRVMQRDVTIAAVGEVHASLVSAPTHEPIVMPNVVRAGEYAILNAAFGIGFNDEAVNVRQFRLAEDAMLLLIIGGNGAIGSTLTNDDAESFIEHVASAECVASPIVAIVR